MQLILNRHVAAHWRFDDDGGMPNIDTYTHLTAVFPNAPLLDVSDLLRLSCFESSLLFPISSSSHTLHQQLDGLTGNGKS
jgi:hypothetical protein